MTSTHDDGSWASLSTADQADAIASAALGVDGVAALHGGMFGEVGTYLPGRRVEGIRFDETGVDVHVSVEHGASVRETAIAVRRAVADGVGSSAVTVTVEDVLPTTGPHDQVARPDPGTREISADDPASDPRTSESLLAATPDGATNAAVDVATAVAESTASPRALGAMLVALGGSITDEDDLVTLLQRVVDVAHEAIDGADSAGITIALGGRKYTAVHTDTRTLAVDQGQYDADDGPCLHAARTGETVLVDVDGGQQAWPEFASAAAQEGIHSFLAAALSAPGLPLGALNLYGRAPAAFETVDADILDLLTTTVSRAIADFARFKSAVDVADALRAALESRAPIEQAKGILMGRHGVDAERAFALIKSQSQNTNRKVRDIARDIVTSTQ